MDNMNLRQAELQMATIRQQLADGKLPDEQQQKIWLDILVQWECWEPFLIFLDARVKESGQLYPEDEIQRIRILNLYLFRPKEAVTACINLIRRGNLSFDDVRIQLLPAIFNPETVREEIDFCEQISPGFPRREDQISCLEYTAFLYGKKLHWEQALPAVHQNILKLDPGNIRSLKFFKGLHSQNQNWEETASYLRLLLGAVRWREEKYRIAQELALVVLYQLGKPEEALKLIEQYCADSPLDTSTIRYDAYSKLRNWEGCLQVLRENLQLPKPDHDKAAIHLLRGQILARYLKKEDEAVLAYREASDCRPDILEPLEEEISVYIRRKDWEAVAEALNRLSHKIRSDDLQARITQVKDMLEYGLRHRN